MTRSFTVALLACALIFPTTTSIMAQEDTTAPVIVEALIQAKAQGYDEDGAKTDMVTPAAFKLPVTTSKFGKGNTVGLPYKGGTIYLRRIHLKITRICVLVEGQVAREGSAVVAGPRMGAGSSRPCIPEGEVE